VVAIISYEGRVKSGGYAKYNIAQVINQQLEGTNPPTKGS
jgi:hypothetical protein